RKAKVKRAGAGRFPEHGFTLTRSVPMNAASTSFEPLRVLTYNVHACKGRDRVISPSRIAEVIASAAPDVVALQEVDVGRMRSDRLDQAELIARELNMDFHFAPAMRVLEEEFGDAVLTARPM